MNGKETHQTIAYYDSNAKEYAKTTQNIDFHTIQDTFLSYLKPNAKILDLGCGAGRDTKYFLDKGYKVDAIDGSKQMCLEASRYTGIQVIQMNFHDLNAVNEYDGIWACASLLHIPSLELPQIFQHIFKALKNNGILYVSFKYGNFEGVRDNRYYTDLTEDTLKKILTEAGKDQSYTVTEVNLWTTGDSMPGRQVKWLNGIYQCIRFADDRSRNKFTC